MSAFDAVDGSSTGSGCTDQPANVEKSLANSEPSTHGTKRTWPVRRWMSAYWGEADIERLWALVCL
jgi:hypothetical protein